MFDNETWREHVETPRLWPVRLALLVVALVILVLVFGVDSARAADYPNGGTPPTTTAHRAGPATTEPDLPTTGSEGIGIGGAIGFGLVVLGGSTLLLLSMKQPKSQRLWDDDDYVE